MSSYIGSSTAAAPPPPPGNPTPHPHPPHPPPPGNPTHSSLQVQRPRSIGCVGMKGGGRAFRLEGSQPGSMVAPPPSSCKGWGGGGEVEPVSHCVLWLYCYTQNPASVCTLKNLTPPALCTDLYELYSIGAGLVACGGGGGRGRGQTTWRGGACF
jgi:hypothetical protein